MDLPAFYFDPIINPISAYKVDKNKAVSKTEIEDFDDLDLDQITMPEIFEPFLNDELLFDNKTADGIALLWAPKPFNQRTGKNRRCFDIPLVGSWFKERCDPKNQVKVRVSY